jgi:hypothetical protein
MRKRKSVSRTHISRLDILRGIAVTSGFMLLVYALTQAANSSFLQTGNGLPLIISAAVFAFLFFIERR